MTLKHCSGMAEGKNRYLIRPKRIHVVGMTREKVAVEVKKRLMESKEGIKDPTVTVEFANMYVTVMGEVARAGQYDLIQDKTTILDVLGKVPPNPTELIEEGRFATIIEEARSMYDLVFIDCPPIDILADTQII